MSYENWKKECEKQKSLLERFKGEGRKIIPSKNNLSLLGSVGEVKKLKVLFKGLTEKGLCIFYLEGEEEEKAFHLVRSDLILKYNDSFSPSVQECLMMELSFVVGVRAVGKEKFVIGLRLPR